MAYISFQPSDYFNTKLYTGNGTTNTAQTGVGFQPDWVWIKERSSTSSHLITDAVRGANKSLSSNLTGAESTETQSLISFDSDGFTVGSGGAVNESSQTYVAWNWKANGQGSANSDGSITTTYTSANTTSGFSISTYTGTGANATIGHGLGVKPSMIICKRLNSTGSWITYHSSIGATKYLYLNATDTEATNSTVWQDTEPTTSVFSVGTASNCNASGGTYVAYCFAEKKGFSKMGLWEGNSSTDGTFVYTGFSPAFILHKAKGSAQEWNIFDVKRDPYNVAGHLIQPNNNSAESDQTGGSLYTMDILSNGFKLRGTDTYLNASGQGYIYMAFASEPLVSSNDIPATAR